MENVDDSITVSQVPPLGQSSSFLLMERLSLLSSSQFSIEQQQQQQSGETNKPFLESSSSPSLDISTRTFAQMNSYERKLSEEINQLLEDDNDELLLLLPVLDKYGSKSTDRTQNTDQYSQTEKGRAIVGTELSEENESTNTPICNPNDSDSQDTVPYSPTESIQGCDIIPQYVDLQPIENDTSEAEHSLDELIPHSPSETSNLFGEFYHDHVLYPTYSSPIHPLSTGSHGVNEIGDCQEISEDECFDILNSSTTPLRDQASAQTLDKSASPKDNNDNLSILSGDSFVAHLFDGEDDDDDNDLSPFENKSEENTSESLAVVTDGSSGKTENETSKKYKNNTTLRDYFIPPRENIEIGKESAMLPFATFDEKKPIHSDKTAETNEETRRWPRMGLPKRSNR